MTTEQHLSRIREHIEQGERAIETQRMVVKEQERNGFPTLLAKQLLKELEADLGADYATHAFLMRRETARHLIATRSRSTNAHASASEG